MTEELKIVIAEDNALIGMDLAELLEGLGHHVCAMAYTEAETVAAAMRCDPDLMIVDGDLGEGSGMSAMRRILARGPMPHFYITGDPREILVSLPDAVVVGKPFNLAELECGIAQVRRANGPLGHDLIKRNSCLPACPIPTCFQRT